MRKLFVLSISLQMFCAGEVVADGGFTVLYEEGPWSVFRFTDSAFDGLPDYCSARSAKESGFLEFLATMEVGCINAEDTTWAFRERIGEVGFMVSTGGVYIEHGAYYSNGLQVCSENAANDALIDLLSAMQGDMLDIYDDGQTKIASFPFSGRSPALRAWKACREGL